MKLEQKLASYVLAAVALTSCGQNAPQETDKDVINYAKFNIQVAKTVEHNTYDVQNGIIISPPDNKGGIIGSNLEFCDQNNVVEVPIADTDYREKDKAITPREEKGEVPSSPFYKAKPGTNPCELVLSDGKIIKAIGFKQ